MYGICSHVTFPVLPELNQENKKLGHIICQPLLYCNVTKCIAFFWVSKSSKVFHDSQLHVMNTMVFLKNKMQKLTMLDFIALLPILYEMYRKCYPVFITLQ